ncbi:BACON domain-containing protein [Dysgonomonas sp. 25]|uniref:BACON domain-containing protein n=1 Tax=Dysgonomonas sp. 25 TaxID=2302933 RepID=UPI0013D7955C|nr:BACON domain-containing protein [Dysgonomonas sp. 25]NDV70138.1 hypothetical protein [Dysgonomonas sp. 25]
MSNRNLIYKVLGWSTILLATVLFGSCSDENGMDAFLDVSKSEIELTYRGLTEDGNQANFEVGASQPWEVISKDEWITLNHTSGERGRITLFISAPMVDIHGGREGTIVIQSGKSTEVVSIVQNKKIEALTITPAEITVGKSGLLVSGDKPTADLNTNSDWRIESDQTWLVPNILTGTEGDYEITFNLEHNNTTQNRTAKVMVYSGELKDSVMVKQTTDGLKASMSRILANKNGNTEGNVNSFTVSSYANWTATSDSWITVTPATGGVGKSTVTFSIDPNTGSAERTGKITFTSEDGLIAEVDVIQTATLSVYDDDGQAIGYVYLNEDFSWCTQFGGQDQVANPATYSTIAIYSNAAAKAEFDAQGYEDFNPSVKAMYLAAHYLKMNKGNNQTGFVIPSIPNIADRKATNMKLSFDSAPNINTSGVQDVVDITVEILSGPGSVDVNDGTTKVSAPTRITVASFNQWDNMSFVLYGATAETKVVIRTTKQGESGQYRWFLDNVKFEKHSVLAP